MVGVLGFAQAGLQDCEVDAVVDGYDGDCAADACDSSSPKMSRLAAAFQREICLNLRMSNDIAGKTTRPESLGQTDWERVTAMADEDIAEDEDNPRTRPEDLAHSDGRGAEGVDRGAGLRTLPGWRLFSDPTQAYGTL